MAACARCGALLPGEKQPCRRCGTPPAVQPGETLPLGSPAEPSSRAETLLLGSGVPLDQPEAPEERSDEEGRRDGAPIYEKVRPLTPPLPRPPEPRSRPRRAAAVPRSPSAIPRPEPAEEQPAPERAKRTKGQSRQAKIGMTVLGVATFTAVALALTVPRCKSTELGARVRFDTKARPELVLDCADCADGSEVRHGSAVARFAAGKAMLPFGGPLGLGNRLLSLELRRAGERKFRSIELPLALDWTVSADTTGLSDPKPRLGLVFDTAPGVSVIVDGSALPTNSKGGRRWEQDVSREVTGEATTLETLTRKVPYGVRLADGSSVRGVIELSTEVVPLRVDAPDESIVIESSSFMLAGATQPDGAVSVEGRPITVDPSGHFAQLMSVSAIGDTTFVVRASSTGRAPRLVPVRVRRVASLAVEAQRFSERASRSYAAIAADLDGKAGWAVALGGQLVEVHQRGQTASLVLEVTEGCTEKPCRVRLELGCRSTFAIGDRVQAFGYLAGKWLDPSDGRARPQVRVEFMRGET